MIPLLPVLRPGGGRGFISPVDCLIDQDTAQPMETLELVLWTLTRTGDVWGARSGQRLDPHGLSHVAMTLRNDAESSARHMWCWEAWGVRRHE